MIPGKGSRLPVVIGRAYLNSKNWRGQRFVTGGFEAYCPHCRFYFHHPLAAYIIQLHEPVTVDDVSVHDSTCPLRRGYRIQVARTSDEITGPDEIARPAQ